MASLIALNRALMAQQLLRGIAHDLRNNLQVVALGSSLGPEAQAPAITARVDRSLDEMVRSLERLSHMGRAPEAEPLATGLTEVLDELRILADLQRNLPAIRLSIESAGGATMVAAPKSAIVQMVLNLVANAKEAGGRVSDPIALTVTMPMEGRVAIVVVDAGSGMPATAGSLYFSTKDRTCHGGIGLVVTRALAEEHGGELTWAPGPTGGTAARLVLPVSDPG